MGCENGERGPQADSIGIENRLRTPLRGLFLFLDSQRLRDRFSAFSRFGHVVLENVEREPNRIRQMSQTAAIEFAIQLCFVHLIVFHIIHTRVLKLPLKSLEILFIVLIIRIFAVVVQPCSRLTCFVLFALAIAYISPFLFQGLSVQFSS